MKKRVKGLISWWLALVMLFSTLATPAMALPSNRIYIYAGTEPLKANDELYPYVREGVSEGTQLSSLVPLGDGVTLTGWNLWEFDNINSGYVITDKLLTKDTDWTLSADDVEKYATGDYYVFEPIYSGKIAIYTGTDEVAVDKFVGDYQVVSATTGVPVSEQASVIDVIDSSKTLEGWDIWSAGWSGYHSGTVWNERISEESADYTLSSKYFVTSDDPQYYLVPVYGAAPPHKHPICGAEHTDIGDHTGTCENVDWTAWESTTSLPSAANNYYLTADVTISSRWEPANGTVLCLNGHTITMSGNNDVIKVGSDKTFTLTDCGTTGKKTHASGATGRGVFVSGGTFEMYGGSITGNSAEYGGGVSMNTGTFNMYGGDITGNTATADHLGGGGVYVEYGTFNMYAGDITGNNATGKGGGVFMNGYSSTSIFNMSGGSITGNSATTNGGGVYVYNGTFTVSGKSVITGNTKGTTASNLHLSSGMKVTVNGTLNEGASIGITKSAGRFSTGGAASVSCFSSDNAGYKVEASGENLTLVSVAVPVTGVVLSENRVDLYLGKTEAATLTATVEPSNATNKAVVWSSGNAAVATVDQNGVVTAVGKGYTTITATAADGSGKSDSLYVYVYEKIESVTINVTPPVVGETVNGNNFSENSDQFYIHTKWWNNSNSDVTVEAGKSYTMRVVLFGDYAYFDDDTAASIKVGSEIITQGVVFDVNDSYDGCSIDYTFTTEASKANSVDILQGGVSDDTASIPLPGINETDATVDFTAKILDQYGQEMTGQTVEWSITQATGVSVNANGTVTVTKDAAEGNYTLTATCGGKSDSITIQVEKAESVATGIKIFKDGEEVSEDTIYIPENGQNSAIYTAEVYDQYGGIVSEEDAIITKTHENSTVNGFGSSTVNGRSWKVYVNAPTGKVGSFDLVLTSGDARASVHITFAQLEAQTTTCADVIGTYGQTEELKLNPSGKQTAGAYGFAIKSGASTDVVEVAADGKLTIKNAGETTIVVTAPSDATHASASVEVKVTIDKADISEYTAPTANALTYNGSAQALITEGSATGGNMMYAIGTAEQVTGEWSTDIPTGTDIGTYYVWYKIVGDGNHNNKTFETPITVTIAPNTYIVTYLPGINGTGTQTTDTKTQGVVLTLSGAIFTRTGYTQTGWATTDVGNQAMHWALLTRLMLQSRSILSGRQTQILPTPLSTGSRMWSEPTM